MTNKPTSTSDGCLWIFISIVCSVIGFGFIKIITGVSDGIAIAAAIVIALLVTIKLVGKPSSKLLFRQGLFLFLFFFGIKIIGGIFLNALQTIHIEETPSPSEEIITNHTIVENNDTIPVFTSYRTWRDNFGNQYKGSLTVREKDYLKLENSVARFIPPTTGNFWGNLYLYLAKKDTPSLDLVISTFDDIRKAENLNQMEFAEMVITCIQDIPYSFVLQEACLPANNYELSIREVLEDCPDCCIGNKLYGIQNPVSFLQNLKGDCDTRTVLAYAILSHFKYDVAIVNSDFYKHSILGLNIPARGATKVYNGKKYILWETTAKYYNAGVLPSNFNNVNHWNVVLTSK